MAVAGKPETDRVQTGLALSGIAAPVLYAAAVAIFAALRDGYSHLSGTLTELGAVGTPNAVFFNATGVVLGVLLLAFAVGLHRGIGEGGSRIGPALLALGGVSIAGASVFPANLEDPEAFTGLMHSIAALIGVGLIVAPLFLFRRLRGVDAWRDLASYSLWTGVVAVLVVVVFQLLLLGEESPFLGAVQRLSDGILLLWVGVLAVRLLRLSPTHGPEPST